MNISSPAAKRIRRTPEEARRVILDAAEASMAEGGPAGIRLQDVAAAAGVSHPTILHHFGSREGLILALNRRTLEDLKGMLIGAMQSADGTRPNAIHLAFAAYRDGLAQRVVWLVQTQTEFGAAGLPMFEEIVASLHALRVSIAAPGTTPDLEDTRAIVHLTTIAAFGDALLGKRLRAASGPAQEAAERERFELWFGALINTFIGARARGGD